MEEYPIIDELGQFQVYFICSSDFLLFFSYWIGVEKKITNYTTYDFEWVNGNTGDIMDYTLMPLHSRRSPKQDNVSTHYGQLWDFWPWNCMGVKTSEMGCFTFQIIISSHKTSFKKFQKKWYFTENFPKFIY